MAKYKIWDKKESLVAPSGKLFTAEEICNQWQWINLDGAKAIVNTGIIGLGVFMEFNQTKEMYRKMINKAIDAGAVGLVEMTDDMTDDEVLNAIELYETTEIPTQPSAEERIAAAMEFQNLMSL